MPAAPVVRVRDGAVYADSREVAAFFEKRHDHVLRDIDRLTQSPDLGDGFFGEFLTDHPTVAGRQDRCFIMSKDGFALLAMGFTGPKALAFKVRYIAEFNAMEAALKAPVIDRATINAMIESALASDPRRAVLNFVSVRQILDDAKALRKGRNRVNRKIGHEMRDMAVTAVPPVSLRRCPHSSVWLFPRTFAESYMATRGASLVAEHNDRVMGQGVLKFKPRAKTGDEEKTEGRPH